MASRQVSKTLKLRFESVIGTHMEKLAESA